MEKIQKTSGFTTRRTVVSASVVLLLLVFYFVYSLSMADYTNKKEIILATYKKNQELWVQPTAASAKRWLQNLKETAQKVSKSELYSIFAQELLNANLGSEATPLANSLKGVNPNQGEGTTGEVEDLGVLVEQLPMMRSVLRDFMQFNSLLSARIVSGDGKTLLTALDKDAPISQAQKDLAEQVIANNGLTLAPVLKTQQALILNYGVPIESSMSFMEESQPVAALLVSVGITHAIDQILTGTPLPSSESRPLFLQQQAAGFTLISNKLGDDLPIFKYALADNHLPFGLRTGFDASGVVFSTGTQVPGSDFWIVVEVPAEVVFNDLNVLGWQIFGLGLAICLGLGLFLALLWWMVIGRERKVVADKFQKLYQVIEQQKIILDRVNSSLGVGLALIDKGGFIHVANEAFSRIYAKDYKSQARNITIAFSGEIATQILLQVQTLEANEEDLTFELEIPRPKGDALGDEPEQFSDELYRVTLYAYSEGGEGKANSVEGAVCIFQNITDFRRKKIEFQNQQRRVIEGLLKVVESVDPYLSGHSAMLQKLAVFMAGHLGLSEKDLAIVSTSAYFSQIGKFYLPKEILLKTDKLSPEDLAMMHEVPNHAHTILKEIDFGMPIATVVHQMSENMDGSGYPQGLQGDEINLYARILAVANIFCAMTSPRSHRLAFTATQAIEQIKRMQAIFDSKVINSLLDVVYNQEQLHEVLQLKEKPKSFMDFKAGE